MHSQGAWWITGAFQTAPTGGILATAGLMPMHYNIKQLYNHSCTRNVTLHHNHLVLLLLDRKDVKKLTLHWNSLVFQMNTKQRFIKSPLDGQQLEQVLETFEPLHESIKLGTWFVDKYPDSIKYELPPWGQKNIVKYHEDFKIILTHPPTFFISLWEMVFIKLIETFPLWTKHIIIVHMLSYTMAVLDQRNCFQLGDKYHRRM
jgi:hypothetical protein